MPIREFIPDPHGMISRVRSKMPVNCSIRLNKFCDTIIAMRLQGHPLRAIAAWLKEQGPEHFIPVPTLHRNLHMAKDAIELPYAEELADRWGGNIDLDTARLLAGNIIVQRKRVDTMVRHERDRQKTNASYFDKRIRAEVETLAQLIRNYHAMLKDPLEAAKERQEADKKAAEGELNLSGDAEKLLTDMVLRGDIKVGENDGDDKPQSVN